MNTPQSLSMKLSRDGIPSLRPFLFLISATITPTLESLSNGSPLIIAQCENTHYGKACPAVKPLK